MKFYEVKHSLDKKIVGNYPQVEEAKHTCNIWEEPKFIEKFGLERIDIVPIVSNAILKNKSKITDLISAPVVGFTNKLLISGKLKKLLEEDIKGGVQFFQSGIYHNNILMKDYWIIHIFEANLNLIDYKNSEIFKTKSVFNKIERLHLNNYSDFIQKKEKIEQEGYPFGILIENLKLKNKITNDFIALIDPIKYIVSERLKEKIEFANCSGIEFMPVNMRLNLWLHGGEREKIYGKS